jgi:excinuclease ABC A subunit
MSDKAQPNLSSISAPISHTQERINDIQREISAEAKPKKIAIRGAREHNLKNIDVELPRDQLIVITGLSGSGKSSLAFDTLYAEGQRRYVESLSAYARQFLGEMQKPDVDQIEGLSPAISIDQKGASRNPRSTVGTATEIYDYLRLLYARIGQPHCPRCGRDVNQQSLDQIVEAVEEMPDGTRLLVMAPLVRDRKGEHKGVFEEARKQGYVRVRVNGQVRDLDEDIELERYRTHTIDVVVDRLIIRHGQDHRIDRARLADSVETAIQLPRVTTSSPSTLPAFTAASACPRSNPAPSRSIVPTAPARSVAAWACSLSLTRTWSCRTATSACPREPSPPGPATRRTTISTASSWKP